MCASSIVYILPGRRAMTVVLFVLLFGGAFLIHRELFGSSGMWWDYGLSLTLSFLAICAFLWILGLWLTRRRP